MSFANFERRVVELIIFLKFYLYGKLKDNIRLFLSDICQRNRCQESIFARGNKNTKRLKARGDSFPRKPNYNLSIASSHGNN